MLFLKLDMVAFLARVIYFDLYLKWFDACTGLRLTESEIKSGAKKMSFFAKVNQSSQVFFLLKVCY